MASAASGKISARRLFFILSAFFIISLIPLYVIGLYAHPSVDDYYYGAYTAAAWRNTHSLGKVISCAANETAYIYNTWQGNFVAIFLMQLEPAIFGEQYYFVAPFLLITTYASCTLFFVYTAMKKIFGADEYRAGIIAISLTFVSMQLANVPSDSFYWYNGSIYYTFFYSLMLLMFSVMIRMCQARGLRLAIMGIFCTVLAFLIGGSNYATALLSCVILALCAGGAAFAFIIGKNKKFVSSVKTSDEYSALSVSQPTSSSKQPTSYADKKISQTSRTTHALRVCFFVLIALSCMAGLFISMAAPGNAARQESVGGSTGLVLTFVYTFAFGGYSLANVWSAPCIIFFLCMVPFFFYIVRRTDFSYCCPLLMLIFTFGLYCCAGTPVFYAQGLRIPYRLMNIIYFSAYIFTGFNLLYFLGWINRKYGDTPFMKNMINTAAAVKNNRRRIVTTLIVCLTAFCVACVGRINVNETEYHSGKAGFGNMPMSLSAIYSLVSGEAELYDAELTSRDEYLSSTDKASVAVTPLSVRPELIFHTDITPNANDWRNSHVCKFYNKEAVWTQE